MHALALRFEEQLDLFEHVPSGIIVRRVGAPPDPFTFQKLEEAFGDGVVVTIATSAHAGFQVLLAEKRLPLPAGVLGTLI